MALFRKTLDKLAAGLAKTRKRLASGMQTVLTLGRKIDEDLLDELEEKLLEGDIGVVTAMQICGDLRQAYKDKRIVKAEEVIPFLKSEIKGYWPQADRNIHLAPSPPTVILVAGVNGVGKTTSIAKLAYAFKAEGKKVCLAAGDTFRAAAVEQLTVWAGRLDVDIIKHKGGGDPAAVVFDAMQAATAAEVDYLIVDTAGRLQTNRNLMAELEKVVRIVTREVEGAPHEVLLVLDGLTGQNGMSQARLFGEAVGVTGIILAKLDSSSKGGVVFSVTRELGVPIKFVGTGESIEDLAVFDAAEFVEALLRRDE